MGGTQAWGQVGNRKVLSERRRRGSCISGGEPPHPRLGADTLGKAQVAQVASLRLSGAIPGGPRPRGQCSDRPSAPAKASAAFRAHVTGEPAVSWGLPVVAALLTLQSLGLPWWGRDTRLHPKALGATDRPKRGAFRRPPSWSETSLVESRTPNRERGAAASRGAARSARPPQGTACGGASGRGLNQLM